MDSPALMADVLTRPRGYMMELNAKSRERLTDYPRKKRAVGQSRRRIAAYGVSEKAAYRLSVSMHFHRIGPAQCNLAGEGGIPRPSSPQ